MFREVSPLEWPHVVWAATGAAITFVAALFVLRSLAPPPPSHLVPILAIAVIGFAAGAWVGRLTARESGRAALKRAATGLLNRALLFPFWFFVSTYLLVVVVEALATGTGLLPGGVVGQYRFVGDVLVATVAPAATFPVGLAATLAYEGASRYLGTARS